MAVKGKIPTVGSYHFACLPEEQDAIWGGDIELQPLGPESKGELCLG